jgi:hypothetical protein
MKTSLVQMAFEQGLELRPLGPDKLRVVCIRRTPRAVLLWVQAHKAQLLAELRGDLVQEDTSEGSAILPELQPIPRAALLAQLACLSQEERRALLEELEERAAIMEFEAGQSREAAEHGAVIIVLDRYRKGARE